MNELLERDSESADPQQGQTPFCKSETKFVGTPHDLDPLQNVIGSSLADATSIHQVS